jgi:hypothetical protein
MALMTSLATGSTAGSMTHRTLADTLCSVQLRQGHCALGFGVEVTENLAQVRILHQVDHRRMTAWRECPDVVLQPLVGH